MTAMHRRPPRRSAAVLLALLLAALLLPTLARALAEPGRGAWAEVCTARGLQWVAVADADGDAPAPLHEPAPHCPWCRVDLDPPALSSATPQLAAPAAASAHPAPHDSAADTRDESRRTPPARGPPASPRALP